MTGFYLGACKKISSIVENSHEYVKKECSRVASKRRTFTDEDDYDDKFLEKFPHKFATLSVVVVFGAESLLS